MPDTLPMRPISNAPLRILLELRPALAGHAGIPQATRLLFRSLASLGDLHIEGLMQSGERVLRSGLPTEGARWFGAMSADQQLNRLGRVVIAIEQGIWDSHMHATAHTIGMAIKHLLGGTQKLTRFDPRHFQDFVWRRFFAHTLPPEDFDIVMRTAFRIARVPWNAMHICALVTRKAGYALYPRLDTSDFDVMIAETPYPATVAKNTKLIIRYHDAIPLLMPHTISDRRFHQAFHYRALRKNVESGAWFVCVSDATRRDLLSVFPQAEARSVTIHNMVSHHYFSENSSPDRIPEIIKTRLNCGIKPPLDPAVKRRMFDSTPSDQRLEYLLIVSTVEPRKNHLNLLTAWERLRAERFPALKLIVVGALGWHHKPIVRKFRPWLERGDVFFLEEVLASELRVLYRHARATICPSFGEGFDFSGVEAMRSGGAVVASDIPVHREVYADAAEYFNPYSVEEFANAIERVIEPGDTSRRDELAIKGVRISARYTHDEILPKWRAFLSTQTLEHYDRPTVQGSTDLAWEEWGRRDPYFGVFTDPKFRRSRLTSESKQELFDTGPSHVHGVLTTIRKHIDANFAPQTVLDFGCGVGRLLLPFAAIAENVVGLDVSRSMLEEARRNCDERGIRNVRLLLSDDELSTLTDKFDLIHSCIVFQHIPVPRGRAIIARLLEHLRPGGVCAIQLTYSKTSFVATHGAPPPESPASSLSAAPLIPDAADPEIQMNPYNVNEILFLMQGHGVQQFHVEFSDHGGELGIFLFFSAAGAATSINAGHAQVPQSGTAPAVQSH
jgi:glycosyltransferase involved in cell wall biosynthesis/2-polyprenyl-3-methyl-5-hydroxy-6-metoxy-1,4-benzoquinol methylase